MNPTYTEMKIFVQGMLVSALYGQIHAMSRDKPKESEILETRNEVATWEIRRRELGRIYASYTVENEAEE